MEPLSPVSSDPGNASGNSGTLLVLQLKPIVTFKSKDEYLCAMKEDLAEWFTCLYQLTINVENFFEVLETGVYLCMHANKVRDFANEQSNLGVTSGVHSNFVKDLRIPQYEVPFRMDVKPGTFQARDNISNFITWTRKLGIPEVLCFETDDLVLRKNEKSVVLCLLEIARVGAKLGMIAPTLVRMEEEIDAEIAGDPPPQIITCDVKSLHEMVLDLAGRCTCPVQFPIIKVGDGKYKIGDSQTLVFVRILRKHVMIRVGGGWDTLEHYLDKHDPCRCNFAGHRSGANKTPARRASTSAISHSVPNTPRSPRKMSSVGPYNPSQRPSSPIRMRSESPGPASGVSSPRKQSGHRVDLNSSGPQTKILVSRNSALKQGTANARGGQPVNRDETTTPSRVRSPSPQQTRPASVRPASAIPQSITSPRRCASPEHARRNEVSQSPRKTPSSLSIPNKTCDTSSQPLSSRPGFSSMNSIGSDVSTPDSLGSSQNSLNMDKISTMTLDEFKKLLNANLTVPNEGSSGDESSKLNDSLKHSYGKNGKMFSEVTSRYKNWKKKSETSKSFDSSVSKSHVSNDGFYELDRLPVNKNVPSVVGSITRPKTPVSSTVTRPKTPTSSLQRPKTPTSNQVPRPKTPVSSVSRSKTPASGSIPRPKTPVSVSVPRPKTPVSSTVLARARQAPRSQTVDRPKTPSRMSFERSHSDVSGEDRNSNRTQFHGSGANTVPKSGSDSFSYQRTHVPRAESEPRELSRHSVKTSNGNLTSGKPEDSVGNSTFERRTSVPTSLTESRTNTSEGVKGRMNSEFTSSLNKIYSEMSRQVSPEKQNVIGSTGSISTSVSSDSVRSSHVTPKPRETSPSNVGYVSIVSYEDCKPIPADNTYKNDTAHFTNSFQAMKQLCSNQRDSKTLAENEASLGNKTDSVQSPESSSLTSLNSNGNVCAKTESSLPEPFETTENAEDDMECELLLHSNQDVSTTQRRMSSSSSENQKSASARPSTPSLIPRPSTPSMIPRPATPSRLPRPSTPLSNLRQSIENLEQKYSSSAPGHVKGDNSQASGTRSTTSANPTNGSQQQSAGRPPTAKKSNIIAKAPGSVTKPSASGASSYTSKYLAKRSMTPGPSNTRSAISVPRRSRTPGPNDHSQSFEDNQRQSSAQRHESPAAVTPKAGPNPAVARRPRTPSLDSRNNKQTEETVLTVNREQGRHVIMPTDSGKQTKPPSPKPVNSRIIARSPSAKPPTPTSLQDRSRGRTRSVIASSANVARTRPKSTTPHEINRINSAGEQVLTVDRTTNGHVINNRTEAWVESTAKTTSTMPKRRLPSRQCKTPNPQDMLAHELESRSLEEIKAALTLPINGLKDLDTQDLEAPPEDPEMYAKMDELFNLMKQEELKNSVHETPGVPPPAEMNLLEVGQTNGTDSVSLDSNENIKKSYGSQEAFLSSPTSSRSSKPPTPTRPKTPSFSSSTTSRSSSRPPLVRSSTHTSPSSTGPPSRASSTPPRPSTPTRSLSRKSSQNSMTSANSSSVSSRSNGESKLRTSADHTSAIVTKIQEMLQTKPRKDKVEGCKSRIPAPKSIGASGKSRSFTNLHFQNKLSTSQSLDESKHYGYNDHSQSYGHNDYSFDDDMNGEVSDINSLENELEYVEMNGSSRLGSETPVPKLATPLTTGRKEFLTGQRELTRTPKLMRAVSVSSLSSSSQTMSCTAGDDDDYV